MTTTPPPATRAPKRVAIVQSSYIPWKGYFDLVRSVDEFILFDDVQFTKRDWRSRNRIKTPQGPLWLSIPVDTKGRYLQAIKDAHVSDLSWVGTHWKSIATHYAKAPYFAMHRETLEALYRGCREERLSDINRRFIEGLSAILEIRTPLTWSMDYEVPPGKTERLVALCRQAGATEYLSGPSARDYIDPALFAAAGIGLRYVDYSGYPEYPQLHPPFAHQVSVIDLILNVGPEALSYMKHHV